MSDILLKAGIRSNLLQLQQSSSLFKQTTSRLSSGKQVNPAVDNLTNFFKYAFVAFSVFASSSYGAIKIDNFSTTTNDRFADDAQFIANNYDLSGVAIADNNRWVTMISDNVFISANHYYPSDGTGVTFYSDNDPSGLSATRTILSSQRIGSTDIRIGTLNAGLGAGFSFYNFVTDTTNDKTTDGSAIATSAESFINSVYYEADAYMFGRSETSFPVSQDIAVGRNKIDNWYGSISLGGGTGDAIQTRVDANTDPNYLEYEAYLQIGDSGAPLMVDTGTGELTIVGMNWFKTSTSNGLSYVGSYNTEIRAYIDTHASPIPELRHYSFFFGIASFFWISNKRKSRCS